MQAEITTTQLFVAAAFPTVLSLSGLVVSVVGSVNNNARISDLSNGLDARFSDLKADVNILSGSVNTLVGAVNDLDKRVTRIEQAGDSASMKNDIHP
jgi:hypothetical protein